MQKKKIRRVGEESVYGYYILWPDQHRQTHTHKEKERERKKIMTCQCEHVFVFMHMETWTTYVRDKKHNIIMHKITGTK